MIKESIEKSVIKALVKLGVESPVVSLEHPDVLNHGDYATSVALAYAKQLGLNPRALAEKILAELGQIEQVVKMDIAGPGFINFHLSPDFFADSLTEIKRVGEKFGGNSHMKGMKVLVEYTDPNPFKEFHIGHLMSNAIGESLSRIIHFHGAETKRACYQGDVGMHVAKAIWGSLKVDGADSASAWGRAYAIGAEAYEGDPKSKTEIEDLNRKIYDRSDEKINHLYDTGRKICLDYFEVIYQKLGTKFDYYFFESQTGQFGQQIVQEFLKKGVFEKSDGAVVFPGEKHGLHTRVFINSQGLPTYEAKELGLAKLKHDSYPYDFSVVITGNEVNEYFKVLLCAMALVFPDLAKKTKHASHGMLRFASGKMSSRTGNVITGESLLADMEEMVTEKIKDRGFDAKTTKEVVEKVAIGAIKYAILRQSAGSDIIYDPEKSISFEGDSGPYLQYAYTRAMSVVEKAKEAGIKAKVGGVSEVSVLEKTLYRFSEVVARAGQEFQPHYITTYLTELAAEFNAYYAKNKIVDTADPLSSHRVALTEAFAQVMENGLNLLGIPVLQKM